jgi:hypothetical protein
MMVEKRKEEGWERVGTGQIAPAVEIHHRHILHYGGPLVKVRNFVRSPRRLTAVWHPIYFVLLLLAAVK